MKNKDRIANKFLSVTVILVCLFAFFAGTITARNNTERSLNAKEIITVDETVVIEKVKEIINNII